MILASKLQGLNISSTAVMQSLNDTTRYESLIEDSQNMPTITGERRRQIKKPDYKR